MNLGFLVLKASFVKHYAGLIERALARGCSVTLLVDQTGDECGLGGQEFPRGETLPAFRNGVPAVECYATRIDLARILTALRLDAVFTLIADPRKPTIWFIRDAFPGLLRAQLQMVPNPNILTEFAAFDVVYGLTPEWVQWAADYHVRLGLLPEAERDDWTKRLESRFVPVGFAEMEQLAYIDRATVRARFGLPEGKPIVLHLPFPFRSTRHHGGFWPRRIYGAQRPMQYVNALLGGHPEFLPYARHGWNDRALVRALRAFCDRNGALLVVKAREEKNPVPGYLSALADLVFRDRAYYPATMLELATIADLCVHFYSTGLTEAVYAGVPNVCISPTAAEWPVYAQRMVVEALSTTAPSLYNYPGVIYPSSVGDFITRFPSARLADYPMDAAARGRFIRRFLGHEDVGVAARILADLERRLRARAC